MRQPGKKEDRVNAPPTLDQVSPYPSNSKSNRLGDEGGRSHSLKDLYDHSSPINTPHQFLDKGPYPGLHINEIRIKPRLPTRGGYRVYNTIISA
ncbi:hypothetical protein Pyn_16706 [Prunus yedoensis var. nudiflora]|uniref:Uncharacterized protein n=1 Tax=Prunus yedoensis var. nudiflora TaxID=2094558 RepID=A0A314Z956_PRUYE|nr:hypothetical protein Pyn_16706 [Prunus yedoensis var. nudiflora]